MSPSNSLPLAAAPETDVTQTELTALRQLLFGMSVEEHRDLHDALNDPARQQRATARVITEALERRDAEDGSVGQALSGPIGNALERAIQERPEQIADAIYPVIGPSIRKAIHAALLGMVASMNQMIEQRLSVRSLHWRIKAWRAGVSLNEYILLTNLVFRVEQVFLLHNETGLLLGHVTQGEAAKTDPDMVSGMLTALQDFVRDSFGLEEREHLDEMRVGELTVRIEAGPYATVAAVVRGAVPADLPALMRTQIEAVHQRWSEDLATFDGDVSTYGDTQTMLTPCLISQSREPDPARKPYLAAALWGILALVAGYFLFDSVERNWTERALVRALVQASGHTLIDARDDGKQYRITLLTLPGAESPEDVYGRPLPEWVVLESAPVVAVETLHTLQHAYQQLAPPPSVQLTIDGRRLGATGSASAAWLAAAAQMSGELSGVDQVDFSGVTVDTESARRLQKLTEEIASFRLYFPPYDSTISAADMIAVSQLSQKINEARALAEEPLQATLVIEGHSDGTGNATTNAELARARAENLAAALLAYGLDLPIEFASAVASDTTARAEARYAGVRLLLDAENR